MTITKAVIPVAGYGTRFLPITKTVNKSMLPILNRPIVDYIVADCVTAGITDIIFIVLPDEQQLQNYYSRNTTLEQYLKKRGAEEKLELIANIHRQANFHYVQQPQDGRYGTAIPVQLVKKLVEPAEAFLMLMGDDFVFNPNGESEIAKLIDTHIDSGAEATVSCSIVAKNEVHKYSMVSIQESDKYQNFQSMIEKPTPEEVTTNLVNISKYIFDYSIFDYADKVVANETTGEYYLTDAVNDFASDNHKVIVHPISGEYLDCGNLAGWIHANETIAKAQRLLS